MKVKTKLFVGFGIIIAILIIISINILYAFHSQKENIENIVDNYYERTKLAQNLKYDVQSQARLMREFLIANYILKDDVAIVLEINQKTIRDIETLSNIGTIHEETKKLIYELKLLNNTYSENTIDAIGLMEQGNFDKAKSIILHENAEIRKNFVTGISRLTEIEENAMASVLEYSVETYQSIIFIFTTAFIICLTIVIVISLNIIKSFSISLNKIRTVMVEIPNHSFEVIPRITKVPKDEFADIAIAYNKMADALELFAVNEKKQKEFLTEENWVRTHYSELATYFQGIQYIEHFSERFISKISTVLNATNGVLYLKESNDYFTRTAAFASRQQDNNEKKNFLIGEGLIGQCAKENRTICLNQLPKDYMYAESGLGKAVPTSLIILPIQFEEQTCGVLELAKFEPFSDVEKKLLEQVTQLIAPIINRIFNHAKIQQLLAESQSLTEELQAQSEELQQQQEELRTINDELFKEIKISEEKTKKLEIIQHDLETKNKQILLASHFKSEFLANMSHELRTPLNSMIILSEVLARNSNATLSEIEVEYALTIHESGKDLLDLINDILDLAKIESGKTDVYPEEIMVSEIVAFVERQFQLIAKEKQLSFEIIVKESTPTFIFTDDQRLKQILKNLLSNAFKFTDKGKVTFEINASQEKDSKLIFSVIDTGIGIPKDKHEIIFEAFSQVDGTTSRKYGGTGLGLSICRELSQLLGGKIKVDSLEGNGSIFSLFLPDYPFVGQFNQIASASDSMEEINCNENDVDIMDVSAEDELKNRTVLIVDDDMRNIFSLTAVLEMHQMQVLFAENGRQALEMLESTKIDIVLMDIMMPEMDGYETIKHMKVREHLQDIPIIALTAKAMKEDRKKCIEAGASDYISKPVKVEQLISLIKVWLYK